MAFGRRGLANFASLAIKQGALSRSGPASTSLCCLQLVLSECGSAGSVKEMRGRRENGRSNLAKRLLLV